MQCYIGDAYTLGQEFTEVFDFGDNVYERLLSDGVYTLSPKCKVFSFYNHPSLRRSGEKKVAEFRRKALHFMRNHPDFVIASAYETQAVLLLSERPTKLQTNLIGTGFSYGATTVFTVPAGTHRILILAEND